MSKLIKTSGGDYATLAAWASYVNALSLSADETGYVSGVVSDTATVNVGGWTANGFSVILTAQAGEGISVGGRAWYLSSGRASIENSVTYAGAYNFIGENLVVRDIQIRATGSTANYVFALKSGVLVDRCIIRLQSSSQNAIKDINTGRGTVRACLIISSGGGAYAGGGGFDLERCTLVGSGTGTGVNSGPYAGLRAKGCAVIGFTTDFSGTSVASSTHNATDKGSFGGTGFDTSGQVSLASGDFVSTGSGTEDYQPVTGSTKLKNTGTTISGLSVDLFGNSASQGAGPDIGAVEFVQADATAPVLTSPTGTGSTLTSAGTVSTDEANGTLYMVTTASATAPTAAQVKAGQDHTGTAALRASSSAVSATGVKSFSAASCTAGTRYNHFMHEDAAANQSNVVSSASFVVGSGVTFSGTVPAQSGVTGDSFSLDLSTYFSGNMTRTYAVQSGSLTSSGLSLNTSSGIVSGTLGTVGAYSISVRATDTYSDTDDTNSFTITVSSTGTAPTVSTQPSNTTVTAGATASFTAAASGSPTPTVQWQENTGSWTNISGQTTTTLSLGIVGTPDNGRQFRAVFTNSSGSATTNTATLTVNASAGDGTITSEPLKNNMGQLIGAATLSWVGFRNASTGADVLLLTSVAVNSSSIFTTGTNAALAPGQLYAINWKTSDGKYGYAWANAV